MRHRFPYVGADLRLTSPQPDTSYARKRIRVVYHAMCLFTPPAFAGYSYRLLTEGWLRLSRPGAWFCAEVVYQRRSPIHALTGPGVE